MSAFSPVKIESSSKCIKNKKLKKVQVITGRKRPGGVVSQGMAWEKEVKLVS